MPQLSQVIAPASLAGCPGMVSRRATTLPTISVESPRTPFAGSRPRPSPVSARQIIGCPWAQPLNSRTTLRDSPRHASAEAA